MKITLTGALVSTGVGAVDIAMEHFSKDKEPNDIKSPVVLSRLVLEGAGVVGSFLSKKEKISNITSSLFYSNHPLAIKTVRDMVLPLISGGSGTGSTAGVRKIHVRHIRNGGMSEFDGHGPRTSGYSPEIAEAL